jgi:hypothetical protein
MDVCAHSSDYSAEIADFGIKVGTARRGEPDQFVFCPTIGLEILVDTREQLRQLWILDKKICSLRLHKLRPIR